MRSKPICFRFDVDTHRCLNKGTEPLLNLGRKHDVRFTFFVNMGRATDRLAVLGSMLKSSKRRDSGDSKLEHDVSAKLSNLEKLGFRDYLQVVLANPLVGAANKRVLLRAAEEGHEVGLHGGRNHGTWQREGSHWDAARLRDEISWSHQLLGDLLEREPSGFTSPGFSSNSELGDILRDFGFRYSSDQYGADTAVAWLNDTIADIPCNILGKGGVAYLEHQVASNRSRAEIKDSFASDLDNDNQHDVVYDHPMFAGIQCLDQLEDLIVQAKSSGRTVTTLQDIRATYLISQEQS